MADPDAVAVADGTTMSLLVAVSIGAYQASLDIMTHFFIMPDVRTYYKHLSVKLLELG